MLTDAVGVGEWGFSALVEADGNRVLFDTGGRPETVLNNARELGVDLSSVEDVILSHNHWDHVTGGKGHLRGQHCAVGSPPADRLRLGTIFSLVNMIDPGFVVI